MGIRVSLAIITLNEARTIERCVDSCRGLADEIVVVDSGSTDGTQELAAGLGARVVHHAFDGFGAQKNRALDLCSGEWVLNLDADEWLSDGLRAEMASAVAHAPADCAGWEFPRHNGICGRWPRFGGWRERRKFRLWRRGCVRWAGSVHEWGEVTGPLRVGRLCNPLFHDMGDSWERYLRTQRSYADRQAAQMHERGRRGHLLGAPLHAAWAFFRCAVLQLGMLEGGFGIRTSTARAAYAHRKWTRLRELGGASASWTPSAGLAIALAAGFGSLGTPAAERSRREGGAVNVVPTCGFGAPATNLLPNSAGFPGEPWRSATDAGAGTPVIERRGVRAPDGSETAVTVRFGMVPVPADGGASMLEAEVPVVAGQPFTFAFSVRGAPGSSIACRGVAGREYTQIPCDGTWQRVSLTEIAGMGRRASVRIGMVQRPAAGPTAPPGPSFELWGPQVQPGRSAPAYAPTGPMASGAWRDAARALHPMHFLAPGETRTRCVTAGAEDDAAKLEGAATNLLRWSLALGHAPWTLEGIARVDAGAAPSPVGIIGADRMVEDGSDGFHGARQHFTCDRGRDYVASVFARAHGRDRCRLALTVPGGRTEAEIDLKAGHATRTDGTGEVRCEPIGEGWFRASVAARSGGTGTGEFRLVLAARDGTTKYRGDGRASMAAWGAQVEEGSVPTSHIPTFYVAETRAAELPGSASR